MGFFFKNDKEKYFDSVKNNYGPEEKKVIKELLKSDLTLEEFQDCIMPIIDNSKTEIIAEARMNGFDVSKSDYKRNLTAEEIKAIAECYNEGLTRKQVNMIINGDIPMTEINAKFIELSKEAFKNGMETEKFYQMSTTNSIEGIKDTLIMYKEKYPKELIEKVSLQDPNYDYFVFNDEQRKVIMDSYNNGLTIEEIEKFTKVFEGHHENMYSPTLEAELSAEEMEKASKDLNYLERREKAINGYWKFHEEQEKALNTSLETPIFSSMDEIEQKFPDLPKNLKDTAIITDVDKLIIEKNEKLNEAKNKKHKEIEMER